MRTNIFASITKKASKTFYSTTMLFPKEVREDVFILYSFLRNADDLIDSTPPKIREFKEYKKKTFRRLVGKKVDNIMINAFGNLVERKKIDHNLIKDFFTSLEIDLKKKNYETFEELQIFIYGVAEVVGLLMANVMELPKKSYMSARKLGTAMQLVNIIRDIEEDRNLGRVYIPQKELLRFNLSPVLTKELAEKKPREFKLLINYQIERIIQLLHEAKKGFIFIPKEYILPIRTATEIYFHTAKKIEKNPLIIFQSKIRLSKLHMSYIMFKNLLQK